ncbi:monocarboxylate transporter [Plakobranchus ocellatus]|uniref:Monocarboxylate transporter n=1 Tax=Plakobranchus ocellatus TaxID=259542 RepID=A0AAV3YNE4_9GAST|nr:monocarboxylate transporter [Plakobranchus ocellatus]
MKLEQDTPEASQGEDQPEEATRPEKKQDGSGQGHAEAETSKNNLPADIGAQNSKASQAPQTLKDDDKHEQTSASSADYITPPDGGWGWLVVLSSFMIHVIADGIVYSFGVFLTELVDYFHAGRGEITWVGSLQPAITFTVGPLSSALTNRYGCRVVTIAGAIVSSAGFIMSVWAPNHYYLYFTSGVMAVHGGYRTNGQTGPRDNTNNYYFETKRSFATGLAVCGSGFGTFVLAPVCKLLIEAYSWQGAMLLLGGFTLNIIVCGIIFRPLEDNETQNKSKNATKEAATEEEVHLLVNGKAGNTTTSTGDTGLTAREGQEIISSLQELNALPKGTVKLVTGSSSNTAASNTTTEASPARNGVGASEPISSSLPKDAVYSLSESGAGHVPQVTITDSDSSSKQKQSAHKNNGSDLAQISASQCLSPKPRHNNALDIAMLARSDGALHQRLLVNEKGNSSHRQDSKHTSKTHLAPLQRLDILYRGSLHNIPLYRSQPDLYHKQIVSGSKSSSIDQHGRKVSLAGDDQASIPSEKQTGVRAVWREMVSTLKDMMSMELLKNPVFLMFAISNFFTSIGFNMPFIFLPDRAEIAGIDKNRAALLLSVIGIANTVGRMVFGYLSDRSWVNRLMLYNSALTVCGLATALSPSAGGSYAMLVIYAAVFGLFIGVYVSLTSVVLVDLLGLELLTNSFGLVLLFQGVATFIGPPLAGWLYDWTGSYDISFIAMGTLIAISGAMLFFLPPIQRRHQQKTTKAALKHDEDLGRHIVHSKKEKKDGHDIDMGLVEAHA